MFLNVRRPWPAIAAGLLGLQMSASLCAQSTEDELLSRLKGKPLMLRGFWQPADLHFDETGKPLENYSRGTFTEAAVDVDRVKLHPDFLEIRGSRMGLAYDRGPIPRRVKLHKLSLRIDGHPGEDFGPALDRIFAPDLPSAVPSVWRYWAQVGNFYLGQNGGTALKGSALVVDLATPDTPIDSPAAREPSDEFKGLTAPSKVKAPQLIFAPDPRFSEAARDAGYSGVVEVHLWVLPSGLPAHMRITKPAGLGLEEQALDVVARYRFKPATENGTPVKVDLYVDVNFQMR